MFIVLLTAVFCSALPHRVVILGKTGAGKSTLFNNIVSRDAAFVGIGHIGTFDLQSHTVPDIANTEIWDTPGLFDSHMSSIGILRRIELELNTISSILIAIQTPSIHPGRGGLFPDLDVVQLLFAVLGEEVWLQRVALVFTFAQFDSDTEKVKQVVQSSLNVKRVPLPRLLFAGDDPEGLPMNWLQDIKFFMQSTGNPWVANFRYGAIDAGLLGTDEVSLRDLEAQKERLREEEREAVEKHRAALEAARIEQEKLTQERIEAERIHRELLEKAEIEARRAQAQKEALEARHLESVRQSQLKIRIEEARIRLMAEDEADNSRPNCFQANKGLWMAGPVSLCNLEGCPERWLSIEVRRKLRRMTKGEEINWIRSVNLPNYKSVEHFLRNTEQRWRVPDDLRQFIL